ncbi:hypothetical protein EXIGLDRAFT_86764 [Exidia glandulosa HHB12029]|uniref:Uncharacterized protein n=1 Tax=Exidia glandulosa HHB12029 TaxID=1314781 RepID=A0A165HF73_EXIGL|nr:hypothetical protein EXIGLDRAFT_86764 [Exidia glandulosa HHB12029]
MLYLIVLSSTEQLWSFAWSALQATPCPRPIPHRAQHHDQSSRCSFAGAESSILPRGSLLIVPGTCARKALGKFPSRLIGPRASSVIALAGRSHFPSRFVLANALLRDPALEIFLLRMTLGGAPSRAAVCAKNRH